MERDPRAYLWDIQDAANAIGRFTAGLDAAGYAENEIAQPEHGLQTDHAEMAPHDRAAESAVPEV